MRMHICAYANKTIVELVEATDHASKMGHQLLILFTVTNGVRQGKVKNPYSVAVYLDELSNQLYLATS